MSQALPPDPLSQPVSAASSQSDQPEPAQPARKPPLDRRLIAILLVIFVQIVGASMALPILPLYAQRRFDMDPQTITLLVSAFFFAQFLSGPFIGRLSDTYGRVPILIISQIGTAISFVMLGMAQSVGVLFAARILDGVTGGNIIVAQAYVTDITPPERRTQALGLTFAAFGLGFVFGPVLGGVIGAVFDEAMPFYVAAVATVATIFITWATLDETVTPELRERNRNYKKANLRPAAIRRNTALLIVLGIAFIGQFGLGIVQATFALYGEAVLFQGYDESASALGVGLLLGTVGFGQLMTQVFLLRRLLKRFDESWLVIIGATVRATSMFIFAAITSPYLGVIGSVMFATGTGLMMPPLQSLSTRTVDDELRGGVLGVYQSIVSLATIFSTALAGSLFAITPVTPYWFGGVLFLVAVPCGYYLVHWSRSHDMRGNTVQPAAGRTS